RARCRGDNAALAVDAGLSARRVASCPRLVPSVALFFFNDTATTAISTLSLHDALPIFQGVRRDVLAGHLLLAEVLLVDPDLRERSEEHTSELQSQSNLVCRLLLEKKNAASTSATRP